jgi:hypothetical protein
MLNARFQKIDPSDRAVLAWQQLGKGKATPENRALLRFHAASAEFCPMIVTGFGWCRLSQ